MVNQQFSQGVLLLVVEGEVQQDVMYVLEDEQEVLIGRDANCDICLDYDTNISRRHASILPLGGGEWEIVDHQSSNGTYVNGKQLEAAQILHPGDRLMFSQGGPQFVFESRTPVTMAIEESQPEVVTTPETIETPKYRLEIFPRKLICKPISNFILDFFMIFLTYGVASYIIFLFTFVWVQSIITAKLPLWSIIFSLSIIITFFSPSFLRDEYEFDLDSQKLIIKNFKSLFCKIVNRYHCRYYSLAEFTGVRLNKSVYKGDERTRYDYYQVELIRENKKNIRLNSVGWRHDFKRSELFKSVTGFDNSQDPETAKLIAEATQLMDWIEKYLEKS